MGGYESMDDLVGNAHLLLPGRLHSHDLAQASASYQFENDELVATSLDVVVDATNVGMFEL